MTEKAQLTLDERLAKARRFRDPARRAAAEARVLAEMAAQAGGGEPMVPRKKRPAGGGEITRGS